MYSPRGRRNEYISSGMLEVTRRKLDRARLMDREDTPSHDLNCRLAVVS